MGTLQPPDPIFSKWSLRTRKPICSSTICTKVCQPMELVRQILTRCFYESIQLGRAVAILSPQVHDEMSWCKKMNGLADRNGDSCTVIICCLIRVLFWQCSSIKKALGCPKSDMWNVSHILQPILTLPWATSIIIFLVLRLLHIKIDTLWYYQSEVLWHPL